MTNGMKQCADALAMKRGISKSEARSIMEDAVSIIAEKCVDGGVSFKGQFSIKPRVKKGRKGSINGHDYDTPDHVTLAITVGNDLDFALNHGCDTCKV